MKPKYPQPRKELHPVVETILLIAIFISFYFSIPIYGVMLGG